MKKICIILFISLFCTSGFSETNNQAQSILSHLSLKEKIGQKIMLDFRYWCADKSNDPCKQDLTVLNDSVKNIMSQNHIGGVILFSNNLKDIRQIVTLTHDYQQNMRDTNHLPLLIGTDQEGGIVARLPRDYAVTFPGNMATAAAYLGHADYSREIGQTLAKDIKAVGINLNFAPVVDVNVNPQNPVIHVRAFSDDPELVTTLALQMSEAMQDEGVATTLKHFPGHGDTNIDSHVSLPVVNHSLDEAWKIDLYPYKKIIEEHSPDMIMTAHIQYPALDNSVIRASKTGEDITTPATLSRKIQYDLLRNQIGFKGIIITDALDMGAIAQNFDAVDATIKAFQAGDDIALMPISVTSPEDVEKVSSFISQIESAVQNGLISEKELDESVLRIISLKIKLGLFSEDQMNLQDKIKNAGKVISEKSQRELESNVANAAITLVQNNNHLLPLQAFPNMRIHILTPWVEQGAGIANEIRRLQRELKLPSDIQVNVEIMSSTNLDEEKLAIDNADIVIVGNSTTKSSPIINTVHSFTKKISQYQNTLVFPDIPNGDSQTKGNRAMASQSEINESLFAYQALQYAKNSNKKTIFISLLAPYDLPLYKDVSDAMLAGYDFYGYFTEGDAHSYFRGPSMQALARVIFGISIATGKLPINVPDPLNPTQIIYPRGYNQ